MPLEIVRNDITKMAVDAIVNAAKPSLLGGGGVDGCIHRAAGLSLLEKCRMLGGCKPGKAKLTKGYRLPCRYVIHTVGPVWKGGSCGERETLIACYRSSLLLAKKHGCQSIAFPLISAGAYGYPKDQALRIAADTISSFLTENEMQVYLVIYNREAFRISERLFSDVTAYIDDHYIEQNRFGWKSSRFPMDSECEMLPSMMGSLDDRYTPTPDSMAEEPSVFNRSVPKLKNRSVSNRPSPETKECSPFEYPSLKQRIGSETKPARTRSSLDLESMLERLDAGFSETLLKLIDLSGKKDPEIYKKANVDRKLFSKIRNDPGYRPSKTTALAFAIALELDLEETRDLIGRAGYALSHSSKFDVIIEYFICNKQYDVLIINETLFAFDQTLLSA